MKRLLSFALILMALGLMSCSHSPVGTWIEPTGGTEEIEFTLYKDGAASSSNMGYIEFTSWEKNGDLLILRGTDRGSRKRDFSDTMKIEKITKTELTLSQGGDTITYIKK